MAGIERPRHGTTPPATTGTKEGERRPPSGRLLLGYLPLLPVLGLVVGLAAGRAGGAEPWRLDLERDDALSEARISGGAALDPERGRGDAGRSLRVPPRASAAWSLRDSGGAGEVTMWVFDDLAAPKDLKKRRAGPRWGLLNQDGHLLLVGAVYAPYLSGGTTYAACDHKKQESFLSRVQYLAVKRQPGWHKWTFRFDPSSGLSILYDDRDVNARRLRFDWNKTKMNGFSGVAVYGDAGTDEGQTVWIDDVTVQLSGPMAAKPTPPPPPPPVVPPEDPPPQQTVPLAAGIQGAHPRLLFLAKDVPAMKERITGASKPFFDHMVEYLPACRPPDHTKFLRDATDGQRQGLWRMPTAALHHVLTDAPKSLENATGFLEKMVALDHWEEGGETDSGMSSANIMVGVALTYDMLCHHLDPELREKARTKLLLMARRQYYRGHLAKAKGTHYWQNDPQNNHRWHRNAGLTLATLAIAGDGPGDGWLRERVLEELTFVHTWLPEDGTSHESPSYLIFGLPHLVLAFDAADRVLGTRFLRHGFFRNTPLFRLHTLTPGFGATFGYGDSGETSFGGYHHALWRCLAVHPQPDVQAQLQAFMGVQRKAFDFGWWAVVWHRAAAAGPPLRQPRTVRFFPDVGLACMRDGWQAENVAMVLKCGPYGGHKLNDFRNAERVAGPGPVAASGTHRYVNVAHDDPDAAMFLIYAGGKMLAKTDGYAKKKLTASHNTILVNGEGQKGEGHGWTQPLRGYDMSKMARITSWKHTSSGLVVAEGEAGGAYGGRGRGKWAEDTLGGFRRTVAWVPGQYILIVDTITAPEDVEVTWLLQGRALDAVDTDTGRFRLRDDPACMDLQVATVPAAGAGIVESTAEARGKPLGYKQLQLSMAGRSAVVASLYDAWNRGNIGVSLTDTGEQATAIVSGPGLSDSWSVGRPPDRHTPSTIVALREGTELVRVGPGDRAPE